jgi:hypothetical protein
LSNRGMRGSNVAPPTNIYLWKNKQRVSVEVIQ